MFVHSEHVIKEIMHDSGSDFFHAMTQIQTIHTLLYSVVI